MITRVSQIVISHPVAKVYSGKMMKRFRLIAVALCALIPLPAMAQSQADVLSAELLSGWQMENGHHMAGLSLQLAPSWKTYWRAPGEAGIPPLFNWSGSENVKSIRIHWPSPQVFHTNGMQTIGYHDAVVLPLEVTPRDASKPVLLRAQVDLGVCKDICMPATVVVEALLENPGQGDAAIRAALKSRPQSASEGGVTDLICAVEPIADGLRVTATLTMPFSGVAETVAFESRDPMVWVGQAESVRQGQSLVSVVDMVSSSGAPFALDRSGVTVTVLQQGRAVEVIGCPAP